ncbi:hypothetical protein [Halogranum rubrum]|uniref:Uncharacterized protein n=1 Tax=Halogranum salarium B-1 TaxID=1210908 RepID=J2ZVG0_9EURY|nr:hypothetical protein [Halogranum salarium]EJN57018.1 hypothetical protein HSB1_44040 [Halogranum salarium B-1]
MTDLTPAERVRSRASWLAVNTASLTLLAISLGGVYAFITEDMVVVQLGAVLAVVAFASFAVSLAAGFVANSEERSEAEPRSISDVAEERLR